MVIGGISNFGLTGYAALLVLFLIDNLRLSPGQLGLVLMVSSAGGLIGALIAPALGRGEVCITDRYLYSQLALTGGGRGLKEAALLPSCELASQGRPQLVSQVLGERYHGHVAHAADGAAGGARRVTRSSLQLEAI